MTGAWRPTIPLLPDELFSTWLARAALALGCDPLVLTGDLWPGWRAWTRDLDRGLAEDKLRRVATRSGIGVLQLEEATLRPTMIAIGNADSKAAYCAWVLAQGSRNRRRMGGVPFCPDCLREDAEPYFRRNWRLAWHIGCQVHRKLLVDRCSRCTHPTEPHRSVAQDRYITFCPQCRFDLRSSATEPAVPEAIAFQKLADAACSNLESPWGEEALPRHDWFAATRRLVAQSPRSMARTTGTDPGQQLTRLRFELQSPTDRQLRLAHAWRSLQSVPANPALALAWPIRPAPKQRREPGVPSQVPTQPRLNPEPRPKHLVLRDWARFLRRIQRQHSS